MHRGKPGSKHHVVVDGRGVPLAVILTQANRHDVTQLLPLIDAIPPLKGRRGAPRRRPARVYADRAYDSQPHRTELRRRGVASSIARKRTAHGSGLGKVRWVVERTFAWLNRFRRLLTSWERLASTRLALLHFAAALITWRRTHPTTRNEATY